MNRSRLFLFCLALTVLWVAKAQRPWRANTQQSYRAEYFYDTDPGYGQGTVINGVMEGENSLSLSIDGLSPGAHMLYVRSQDTEGVWSATLAHPFYLAGRTAGQTLRMEYFFDTDPGYGQGTAVAVQDGNDNFVLSLDGIAPGAHTLYVRSQDSEGRWSAVRPHPFFVYNDMPDVVAIEYFFDDNDPGEGQATAVPLPADKREPFAFEAHSENLAPGTHTLNVRLQNSFGAWTLYNATATFTIEGAVSNEPEPYAVLSDNSEVILNNENGIVYGKTLTFYYDEKKAERNGMDVGPFNNIGSQSWSGQRLFITNVVFDASFANCTTITSTAYWFNACPLLTTVEGISNLKTDNVTNMAYMFSECQNLTNLDVSGFNTANVTDMQRMFAGSSGLTTIFAGSGWSTANVTEGSSMFEGCINLVGGAGTRYDENHVDVDYAHIDEGTANPGYLTGVGQNPQPQPGEAEPYAVLSDNNTVLTFYYDDKIAERNGMDVGPFESYYQPWGTYRKDITTVVFDDSFSDCTTLTSTAYWFYDFRSLTDIIGIQNLKTDNVIDMSDMFDTCSSLTSIDVSGFNTTHVTNMYRLFYQCSSLTSIDVSNFNTANVTNMVHLFCDCSSLTSIDVSNFNTANLERMSGMFENCSGLTSLDVSDLNTSKVEDMTWLFKGCNNLTNINFGNFDTSNVKSMSEMFSGCSSLTNIDMSSFNTANVTDIGHMFEGCRSLTSIDISNFNTIKVERMHDMFSGCSTLTTLDLSSFNTENVWNMQDMFSDCSSLTTIYVSNNWSTEIVTESTDMFKNCSAIIGGAGTVFSTDHIDYTYAHIDGGENNPGYFTEKNAPAPINAPEPYAVLSDNNTVLTFYYDDKKAERNGMDVGPFYQIPTDDNWYFNSGWFEQRENIVNVVFDNAFVNCTSISSTFGWFYGCKKLTSITGLNNLKTDNVTNMRFMFDGCSGLNYLELREFNTEKVTDMYGMFRGCSTLTSLDVSGFKTDNVTDMQSMFSECSGLTNLDLGNFNTTKVEKMNFMFDGCSGLTSLNVSSFNTSNVKELDRMFAGCSSLTSLDLSNFNTTNAEQMVALFDGSSGLISLDLRNFNTDKVTEMFSMFRGCSSLASIIAGSANFPVELYEEINNPNLLVYVNEASLAPQGVQNVVVNGVAQEIVLTDATEGNNNWYCPQAFRAEKISYTRNFRQQTELGISRGWEGIALPFTVQTFTHATQGQIAPFGVQGMKHFWLRGYSPEGLHRATVLEANTPYVISMPNNTRVYPDAYNLNGQVTFAAENITVPATPSIADRTVTRGNISMTANFLLTAQSDSVYAINVGQPRDGYAEGSVFTRGLRDIRPFEAYTIHDEVNGTRPKNIRITAQPKEDITGIETLEMDSNEGDWYTIEGYKMQAEPKRKGVYIQDGKKKVVRK